MKRADLTEKILDIKREKGWTWRHICHEIGGCRRLLIVGALLGQMKLIKPLAAKAAELFGLTPAEEAMLNEVPNARHADAADRSADLPLLRDGDGQRAGLEGTDRGGVRRRHHVGHRLRLRHGTPGRPKGDRVKITMSGKFLPYRYRRDRQSRSTASRKAKARRISP